MDNFILDSNTIKAL